MARGRGRRDSTRISSPSGLHAGFASNWLSPLRPFSHLEDGRLFNFDMYTPARGLFRSDVRVVVRNRRRSSLDPMRHLRSFPSQTKGVLAFDVPERVGVCIRRKRRKEVLHALGASGGGIRRVRRRRNRRGPYSHISCRR